MESPEAARTRTTPAGRPAGGRGVSLASAVPALSILTAAVGLVTIAVLGA